MTTSTSRPDISLDDVLYQLALASPCPDAEVINDFVRRFKKYEREIVEFAAELALQANRKKHGGDIEPPATETSAAVSRALSAFQNHLYAAEHEDSDQSGVSGSGVQNPFASLSRDAFRALGTTLRGNTVLVMKLRDRAIDPATISPGFRRTVADALRVPENLLAAHLAAPPEIRPGTEFMSRQKPEVSRQQSFAEAVISSGLTEEQQQYLLGL